MAAVKLVARTSAENNPSLPGNFRPIALTVAVSKLLSGSLKDHWHMRANKYMDSEIQKAFLPTVPGVTEYQAKLAAIVKAAKGCKRSLAISWLDIANANGSVHHALIQFAMAHYHAPPEFHSLLQSWYRGLSATVSTRDWVTSPIPLQIGVYQGDPCDLPDSDEHSCLTLFVLERISASLCPPPPSLSTSCSTLTTPV